MGSQCLAPIACPLSLAALLQSARLQDVCEAFPVAAQRGAVGHQGDASPSTCIPVIALLIVYFVARRSARLARRTKRRFT